MRKLTEEQKARRKEYMKEWRKENRQSLLEYKRKNKEKEYATTKRWRSKHKEHVKEYNKEWRRENPDRVILDNLKFRELNPDYEIEYNKKYPGKKAAQGAKYRACKKEATPPWLSKQHLESIEWFYLEAKRLEQLDGIKREVDHIIPLVGKTVRGLHVPWNLQILELHKNRKKSNKLIEENL